MDSRRKLHRPNGYKPFWESEEEEVKPETPTITPKEEEAKKAALTNLGQAITANINTIRSKRFKKP